MSFSTLPAEIQNLLLSSHSYITKWLVFLTIIFLSSYYLGFVWKNHKQTKYISVAIMRFLLFAISITYLFLSPLLILLMSPEHTFFEFYQVPLTIYSIVAAVIFLFGFIDLMRYGIFVLLKMAGLDINDPNVNEIARQLSNSKHFLKLKRSNK